MWDAFNKVSRRRQSAAGLNPLTYVEVEAFSRLTLTYLSAWEVDLLMRIDDAIIETIHASQPKPDAGPVEVAIDDVAGLKAMFANVPNRQVVHLPANRPGG